MTNELVLDILIGISEQVSNKKQENAEFCDCIKLSFPVFRQWRQICSQHNLVPKQRASVAKGIKNKVSSGEIKGLIPLVPKGTVRTFKMEYDGKAYELGAAYVDGERHLWYEVDLEKLKSDIDALRK